MVDKNLISAGIGFAAGLVADMGKASKSISSAKQMINKPNQMTTRKRTNGFRQERSNGTDSDLLIGLGVGAGLIGLAIAHSKKQNEPSTKYNPKTFRVE